jgi:hypothetical protein
VTKAPNPGIGLDFETILTVTADTTGSPLINDFGVVWAGAARQSAHVFQQDVYYGPAAKGAALLDQLLRHPWLEHHQARAAWAAAEAVLGVNGLRIRANVPTKEIAGLLVRIAGPGVDLAELAVTLRTWSEPHPLTTT